MLLPRGHGDFWGGGLWPDRHAGSAHAKDSQGGNLRRTAISLPDCVCSCGTFVHGRWKAFALAGATGESGSTQSHSHEERMTAPGEPP